MIFTGGLSSKRLYRKQTLTRMTNKQKGTYRLTGKHFLSGMTDGDDFRVFEADGFRHLGIPSHFQ